MPAASIEINGIASTGTNVAIDVLVQLSNADAGGEVSYAWTILDQPEGSGAVLSNAAIENPTFTPKTEGSYRLKLVVNAGLGTEATAYAVVGVLFFRSGRRLPAAGEVLERQTVRGWAEEQNRISTLVDRLTGDSNVIAVTATAGMSVGSIVRIASAVDTIKAGLPGAEVVARATLLGAAGAHGTVGIIIAVCDGAGIAAGKLVYVRTRGLVELSEAGAPAVGDPVYASDIGEPVLVFTATRPRYLGRVVSVGGGFWTWVIDGGDSRWDPRLMTAALGYDDGADWIRAGGTTGSLGWETDVAGSSRLIVPLAVYPGEVLWKVTAQINQENIAARINAYLSRGTATVGGGAIANVVLSAASVGAQVLDVTAGGALVLPYLVPAGMSLWVGFEGSGGGGFARQVGSVTAHVRPD